MLDVQKIHEAIDAYILTNPTEHYTVHIEKDDRQRPYLGLSGIGEPCMKKLWLQWRHCIKPKFPSRMLRLFRRGDLAEYTFVWMLRGIGFTIRELDSNGKQFRVSDYEDHCRGNLDGIGEAPEEFWIGEPHEFLTEFKTANDKKYNECVKLGVEKWNAKYFSQMQTYCGYKGLKGALFCVVNKNTDDLYFEYVPFSKRHFSRMVDRAADIIGAQEPPEKIAGASASWFECKWCDGYGICFGKESSQKLCRTCKYAEPDSNASWTCTKGREFGIVCDKYVDIARQ